MVGALFMSACDGSSDGRSPVAAGGIEPSAETEVPVAVAVMPDVVGMDLQDAQDTIQDAGVSYSRSEDATGEGRSQIVDRNWTVVRQEPAPGAAIGEGEPLLHVVKDDESPVADTTTIPSPATTTAQTPTAPPPTTATTQPTTTIVSTTAPTAKPAPAPEPAPTLEPAPDNVSYANCDAVRAAGAAPIRAGDPGWSTKFDRDGDGIGCE